MSKALRFAPAALCVASSLVALLAASPVAAATDGVSLIYAAAVGSTPPLRELPAAEDPVAAGEPQAINPLGRFERPPLSERAAVATDPVLQDSFGPDSLAAMPATFVNFAGQGNAQGYLPPDTTGAVGPSHYVQAVNVRLAVYGRTGTLAAGFPKDISVLWAGLPAASLCKAHNDGDPIVLYDRLADRWMVSQFAVEGGGGDNAQCIAVSKTGDPTGAWWAYQFDWGSKMNDYPHFGIWPDGYYMTVNQFTSTGYGGAGVAVFERDRMLTGDAGARMIKFDTQNVSPIWSNLGGQLPADLDGLDTPPAGTPGFVFQWDDSTWIGDANDTMRIWEVEVDWGAGTGRMGLSGNYTPDHLLATADATPLQCEPGATPGQSRPCLKQPGTKIRLDDIADGRFMFRVGYRWFGSHDALVAMNTVTGSAAYRAAPRWYELRGLAAGVPVIHQQGTYAPDTIHRWMGSIAMDREGNIGLGYSRMDAATGVPAGIAYTGRRRSDPLGTMPQGEVVLQAGGGAQTSTSNRWGDYSTLTLDPTDDCGFWYTNEYYSSSSPGSWKTRVGAFRFDSCVALLFQDDFEQQNLGAWDAGEPAL